MTSTDHVKSSPKSSPSYSILEKDVSAEDAASPRKLQTMGSTIFSVTHEAMMKANKLPWPMGNAVALVQNAFGTYIQSYVIVIEDKVLQGLGFVDDKMPVLGDTTQECVLFASTIASTTVRKAIELPENATSALYATADKLHRRGLVGSTADWYIENELTLRTYSEGAAKLISKVPGACLVARATSPLTGMAVAWLLKHGEVKDKHLVVHDAKSVDVFVVDDTEMPKDDCFSSCCQDKCSSTDELKADPPVEADQSVMKKPPHEQNSEEASETQTPADISATAEAAQDTNTELLQTQEESEEPPLSASNIQTDDHPEQKAETTAVSVSEVHEEADAVFPLSSTRLSEQESFKKAEVTSKEEEQDPVLNLFERTWSSRQPKLSKNNRLSNTKSALR